MGIYNRDYMRDDGGSGMKITGRKRWSPLTWLVAINVAVFIVQHLLIGVAPEGFPAGGISKDTFLKGHVWEIITHFFIHASALHLLFNMIMLIIFGRFLQPIIGPGRFLKLYFIAGLISGIGSILLQWWMNPNMVGASGAVMAIAIATCFGFGDQQVRLLIPPVTIKLKWLGWALIAIDVIRLILLFATGSTSFGSPTGEANVGAVAHLIGAACGIVFVRRWKNPGSKSDKPIKRVRWGKKDSKAQSKPKKKKPLSKDVDAILDKISEKGFQSLTEEEKKILDKRSQELSGD